MVIYPAAMSVFKNDSWHKFFMLTHDDYLLIFVILRLGVSSACTISYYELIPLALARSFLSVYDS